MLMTVAERDDLVPVDPALEAYARPRKPKQLHVLKGSHFDSYSGPLFETNAACQADFLRRTLCDG